MGDFVRRRVRTSNRFEALADVHDNIEELDSDLCMHSLHDSFKLHARNGKPYVGTCHLGSASGHKADSTTIIPDSGATSTMPNKKSHFSDNHRPLAGVSVHMGDRNPVPAVGLGTAVTSIGGHIVKILNALHVPASDTCLHSVTRHGLSRGCSCLACNGMIHLTFPTFVLAVPVALDGDPRFNLETVENPRHALCDCSGTVDPHALAFADGRRALVTRMHRGRMATQSQMQRTLKDEKQLLRKSSHIQTCHLCPRH